MVRIEFMSDRDEPMQVIEHVGENTSSIEIPAVGDVFSLLVKERDRFIRGEVKRREFNYFKNPDGSLDLNVIVEYKSSGK